MASSLTDRAAGGAGLPFKAPCRAATTANLTLSGEQTVDGVALSESDRVLVKDQSAPAENGIYLVRTGAWERAPDWDGNNDITEGTLVLVNQGTLNSDQIYKVTTTGTIIIGTTSVTITGQGLAPTFPIQVTEGGTGATTAADARTNLGLGTMATQDANAVAITGGTMSGVPASFTSGTITGITDLAIADGGTGASDAATAFSNLKQAASDTATGVVEIATQTEVNAGSDTGRVITPATLAGKPKFKVHKNGSAQGSITSGGTTTLTWSTEVADVGNFFASNAWTPPAGYVILHLSATFDSTNAVDNEQLLGRIFKDGVELNTVTIRRGGTATNTVIITTMDLANGSNAYDARVFKSGAGNGQIDGAAANTWFMGWAI